MDRTIIVTGEGHLSVAPDAVVISGEFTGTYKEYADAVNASASALTSLRKAIGDAGFDMDDLRTTRLSVDPVYRSENGVQRFHGYQFVHGITITEDADRDGLGRLLEAMVSCDGAPEFRVSYTVRDPTEAQSAARAAAVKDAKHKAKELATAAGVRLGDLVSVSYRSESRTGRPMARMAMMMVDAVPEDETFSDTVTMEWEIL